MQRILIVDDNISVLRQISSCLETKYDVILAKSGLLALQICIKEQPDLILLDVEMPGNDGFDVINMLKRSVFLSRIPVIFLTAKSGKAVEAKALQLGARDFIRKPVSRQILLHRIAMHLRLISYQVRTEEKVMVLADSFNISLAELIEFRDENTGGHIGRTSRIVELLGLDLIDRNIFPNELNRKELQFMVRAAPLHDLGKIAISDKILLKAGRLDDEEFSIMKTHALIGGNLIEQMSLRMPAQNYLRYASLIAASHHERYDGKGYPKNLRGEQIPLCARIMSVADVYDAIVSNRIYRGGLDHNTAVNILLEGKGAQFDPAVIDSFMNIQELLKKEYKR